MTTDAKGSNPISQFFRYGVAGAAALGTHLLVLVILVELMGLAKYLSSLIGFLCAIPVNYAIQHTFVFGRRNGHTMYVQRYLLVTFAMAVANTVLFAFLVMLDFVPYIVVQVIVTGVIFVINFKINRSFTFSLRE